MPRYKTPPSKPLSELVRQGQPDQCWEWLAGHNGDGYACYKRKRVCRLILAEKLGRDILPGCLALHSCGNRWCCNPDHIREGTHQDNMQDMTKHGTHDGRNRRCEHHPMSKLSDDDRREIFHSTLPGNVLARTYGVSAATISSIKHKTRGSACLDTK